MQIDNKVYDVIIAGAGAAGLSLAWQLNQCNAGRQLSILLLDKDNKTANDRTWGYWSATPQPHDDIASLTYNKAEFYSQFYTAVLPLSPYRYNVISGQKFYNKVKAHLVGCPNVSWLNTTVQHLQQANESAIAITSSGNFRGRYVFSSLFLKEQLKVAAKKSIVLNQHFKGWVIESENKIFKPDRFRMFDFRTGQKGSLRFFYVLPYSENKALVEYTIFSESILRADEYDRELEYYINNILQIDTYQKIDEEWGEIPMTTYNFKQQNPNIIAIGSVGGASKASTGYTFLRIQNEAKILAAQLLAGKVPVQVFGTNRFTVYDNALLNILKSKGHEGERVFADLFKYNPPERLLKFLDEDTSLGEEVQLMLTVPQTLFIKSLLQFYLG